jgi:hypothetical protein
MSTLEIFYKAIPYIFGLSGWATIAINYFSNKPKIKGRILSSMRATMTIHGRAYTAFIFYLYLTNVRKSSVHVLEYEMRIKMGNKIIKLDRFYGARNVEKFNFNNIENMKVDIPDFKEKLIYFNAKAVEYGSPLMGFAFFVGDVEYHQTKIDSYILTCIDVLGNYHEIECKEKDLINIGLLADLSGIEVLKLKPLSNA